MKKIELIAPSADSQEPMPSAAPSAPTPPSAVDLRRQYHSTIEGIVTLLDWLVVAFILALVFQAFVVQAFQIPTGSMAETLRGAHYRLRCIRCGVRFDAGADVSYGRPVCHLCGAVQPPINPFERLAGDRIFVLKSLYPFQPPQRWDVIVFKNPTNPADNYIKRLIGLPGQTVQILDGDIYIDGKIARKPKNVQSELWSAVYDYSYQPPLNEVSLAPFINERGSQWAFDAARPNRFILDQPIGDKTISTFTFSSDWSDSFKAGYAYNDALSLSAAPFCSDTMICFFVKGRDADSAVGASLEKYGILYAVRVEFHGAVVFLKYKDGRWQELLRILTDGIAPGDFNWFEFANVDRQLVLHWNAKRVAYDLSRDADLPKNGRQSKPPVVQVFGAGGVEVCRLKIFKDIYYLDEGILRAGADTPFTLSENEYFVCGDNSPNSMDSRLWSVEGVGNFGRHFRAGVVPHEFLMGKAVMVYWSQPFRPHPALAPVLPNWDNIRVIVGSSFEMY